MTNQAHFICLVGVDGCGKSALSRMLQQELAARGIASRVVWFRMNYLLTKPVLLFCRLVGLTHRPVINGRRVSIHAFQKAPFVAALVQYLHWVDTAIACFWRAYMPMWLKRETIICDRFVQDILIDFIAETSNPGLHERPIRRLLALLLPRHAKVFVVLTDRQVIVQRRPDVLAIDPYFDTRLAQYSMLPERYGLDVIDNTGSIVESLQNLLAKVGV